MLRKLDLPHFLCLCLVVITCNVCVVVAQTPPDTSVGKKNATNDDGVWTYRKFLGAADYAQAEAMIERARRSRRVPSEDQWRLTLDLAKALRFQQKYQAAEKALNEITGKDELRPLVRVEKAWLQVIAGKGVDAVPVLEALRGDSNVEVRCHAGYLLGKILLEQERIQPCLDACDQAIRDFRKVDFYHNPYDWELFILRKELQKLRAEAKNFDILHKYGEDYANYRRGRFAQARGDFLEAIEYYRKIKAPILLDAAHCYIGACLRDSGMIKEAAAQWQAFIQSDETGLYRGEAMYQLGEMYLIHASNRSQLELAQKWLQRAVDWDSKVASVTSPVTADSIKKILKAFPLPTNAAVRDRFGNFHRQRVGPETIVNRLTSTWYLKDLHLKAVALHAFTLFELKMPLAQTELSNVVTQAHSNPGLLDLGDTPQRLLADAQDGAFVIPPAAWNALPATTAIELHLAWYRLRLGQNHEALKIFQDIYQQTRGHNERMLEWAVSQLGLAFAAFNEGNDKVALEGLAKFESTLSQSPLAPLGLLWAANIYAGQTEGLIEAQTRYAQVVKRVPGTELSARAMLSLAIASENAGDRKTATAAASTLLGDNANIKYQASAKTLMTRLKGIQIQPSRTSGNDVKPGRVIPFDRHLVIPGQVDLTLDVSQYALNDLVSYEIAYSIRSGCSPRTFGYQSSIEEPQALPVKTSPLLFLRAPLLVLPN